MLSKVVFAPLFLNLSLYVILDIPEVPAFKKRAQVFVIDDSLGMGGGVWWFKTSLLKENCL